MVTPHLDSVYIPLPVSRSTSALELSKSLQHSSHSTLPINIVSTHRTFRHTSCPLGLRGSQCCTNGQAQHQHLWSQSESAIARTMQGCVHIRNNKYLFFKVFSHEKPQKHTKNGEKQLKLTNFKTYHGFHRNLFQASVGKAPETAKTCPKQKINWSVHVLLPLYQSQ